ACAWREGGRGIPDNVEGPNEISIGAEVHQGPRGKVVSSEGAIEDAPVGSNRRRGRRVVDHAGRRRFVGSRVKAEGYAGVAAAVSVGAARVTDRFAYATTVKKPATQRCRPLAGEIGIDRDQVVISSDKVVPAYGVDSAIRSDGRRNVHGRPLAAARCGVGVGVGLRRPG